MSGEVEASTLYRYLVMTMTVRTPQFHASVIEPHYAFPDRLRQQGMLGNQHSYRDQLAARRGEFIRPNNGLRANKFAPARARIGAKCYFQSTAIFRIKRLG